MILPATFLPAVLLMVLALVCAGSWTSTFKAARPFRYELYYFDFAFGALVVTLIAALTLGSLRSSELTFEDNLLITAYHLIAYALAAGAVFNLGNVILLAGISVGGIALCVPLAAGVALAIDAVWDFVSDPRINPLLLFGGVGVVLVALTVLSMAYFRHRRAVAEAEKKALQVDPRSKEAKRRPKGVAAGAAVALAIVAGLILSLWPRLAGAAREGDTGVAPYGLTLLFAGGMVFSTLLCSPFVLAFPVGGSPATIAGYFRASRKGHLLGILGGVLFGAGALAANLVLGSPAGRAVGPMLINGIAQGAPLLAFLWGVAVWKEFRGANQGVSVAGLLWSGFLLYAVGAALITAAPLFGSR
jgi:glucose uptake protein